MLPPRWVLVVIALAAFVAAVTLVAVTGANLIR